MNNPDAIPYYTDLATYRILVAGILMKRKMTAEFRKQDCNITFEQWSILRVIYHHPGLIQSELAACCTKDKTNVTRILHVLERNGYIERRTQDTDRRRSQIFLTQAAEKILDTTIPISISLNEKLQNSVSADDYKVFLSVLDQMLDAVKEE